MPLQNDPQNGLLCGLDPDHVTRWFKPQKLKDGWHQLLGWSSCRGIWALDMPDMIHTDPYWSIQFSMILLVIFYIISYNCILYIYKVQLAFAYDNIYIYTHIHHRKLSTNWYNVQTVPPFFAVLPRLSSACRACVVALRTPRRMWMPRRHDDTLKTSAMRNWVQHVKLCEMTKNILPQTWELELWTSWIAEAWYFCAESSQPNLAQVAKHGQSESSPREKQHPNHRQCQLCRTIVTFELP